MAYRNYLVEVDITSSPNWRDWEEVVNGIVCRPSRTHIVTVRAQSAEQAAKAIRGGVANYTGKIVSITPNEYVNPELLAAVK